MTYATLRGRRGNAVSVPDEEPTEIGRGPRARTHLLVCLIR
ncbi:hypothetical protein [Arthrobacter sp. NPDC093139]